jgi:hypothetical protein
MPVPDQDVTDVVFSLGFFGFNKIDFFFGSVPVSRLLERLTDVPLKLKKRNNVREIEVDFK